LGAAVVATAVGAGLVLLAASRVWSTETVAQPPPLSARVVVHTGGSLAPLLPALGLVALAGAGGLLATHGLARRVTAALLALSGLGAAGLALAAGGRTGVALGWVTFAALGGLIAASAGVVAVARSLAWPALGRRYERPAASSGAPATDRTGSSGDAESSRDLWDALDRGEDPTRG